jgi:tetratricopeptide (TPR) repeat protein
MGTPAADRAAQANVRGDFVTAERDARQGITETPNNPWAHYNLAVALKSLGRFDDAIAEYHAAMDLFESNKAWRANGEGDIANCLYGIALTQELRGDPRVAVGAWDNYIKFAQRFKREQPALAIARNRLDGQMRAANMKGPYPFGPPTAKRPNDIR